MNTALKTESCDLSVPLLAAYGIQQHEENGLTLDDPLDGLIIPLEASDMICDAQTSFELALEKIAFIQE